MSEKTERVLVATNNVTFFLPRNCVEEDSRFKQIIPYCVVMEKNTHEILVYERKGSEKRLHNFKSIGIGGHVNENDFLDLVKTLDAEATSKITVSDIVLAALKRELYEEINYNLTWYAYLGRTDVPASADNNVDDVHVGEMFITLATKEEVSVSEEIPHFEWVSLDEVSKISNLESWSRYTLEFVKLFESLNAYKKEYFKNSQVL